MPEGPSWRAYRVRAGPVNAGFPRVARPTARCAPRLRLGARDGVRGAMGNTTAAGPRTLSIDIGGTGVKLMVLDERGTPLSERARIPTPRPATPAAVTRA